MLVWKCVPFCYCWSSLLYNFNLLCISDGLLDCVDPDCCEQLSCGSDPLCQGSADPLALLQQGSLPLTTPHSPTSTHTHSFYHRIRFLLGKAATHTLPGDVPFDTRYALIYSLCRILIWSLVFVFAHPCSRVVRLHGALKDLRSRRWTNTSILMTCNVHWMSFV